MTLPNLFCVRCSLQFDKESDLKKHVVSKQHMKKHVEQIHEEKKLLRERVHTKEEPKCPENEPNLGLEKILYRCGICDSNLETKLILDQHYNASYNETLFTCNTCEYSFSQKGNLKLYVESVQDEKKPTKNDDEELHVDSVPEKKRPFKCKICKKHFIKKSTRDLHVDSVHEKKRPFKCEICNKHFIKKSHMKEHVKIVHENWKPFKCDVCDYASARKGELKRHVLSAHEEKKNVVSAHEEKKNVVSAHEENKHVVSAHEEKKQDVSAHDKKKALRCKMKALKCKLCPFICSTRYFMKKHVESVHENEIPIEM